MCVSHCENTTGSATDIAHPQGVSKTAKQQKQAYEDLTILNTMF